MVTRCNRTLPSSCYCLCCGLPVEVTPLGVQGDLLGIQGDLLGIQVDLIKWATVPRIE